MPREAKEPSMATEGVTAWLTSFPPWLVGHNAHVLARNGFTPSTADPCVYNPDSGAVLLLLYVDDISLSGSDDEQVIQVVEKLKDRFETVDLEDAKFLLGMGIPRNGHAGTIILSQETYATVG